ncbi:MAG: hypothetical protein CO039_02865 [Candidatus Pacebacteria bacterium CG_4_9_14_0_2_um_filter_34_50]|nr:MAG: hypothetical protein CO039_02865 [Candidatus Pacebacteria bacterium CG_4_9_14_0_2_um_filter_34_50]
MTNTTLKKIEQLLVSSQTVFTVQDLATLWNVSNKISLYSNIRYYLEIGRLKKIHKGIYVVGELENINSFEVAQKLIIPSYISYYTALATHGIIFQLYSSIHSMASQSKQLTIFSKNEKFVYHKLKEKVFYNMLGIEDRKKYLIAGPERAICDSLYFAPGLAFDSLKMINFDLLKKVSKIYDNKRLEAEVERIIFLERS